MNDLALHFLAKMKIMVLRDIEREDIEFVSKVQKGGLFVAGHYKFVLLDSRL